MYATKQNYEVLVNSSESNKRIYDFLCSNPIGVLATVDAVGQPHAVVIYFFVDKNFNISFATKFDTLKRLNLSNNKMTMLVAYDPYTQTTVQISGLASEIVDTSEALNVYRKMRQVAQATSESGVAPIEKLRAGHHVAYIIRPDKVHMAMFMRPDPGGTTYTKQ